MAAAFQGSLFDDDLEPAPAPAPASAQPEVIAAEPVIPGPVMQVEEPVGPAVAAVEEPVAAKVEATPTPSVAAPAEVPEPDAPVIAASYEFADEIPLPDEPPPPDTLDFNPEAELRAARPGPSARPTPSVRPSPPSATVAPPSAAVTPSSPAVIPVAAVATVASAEEKAARLAEVRTQALPCTRCDLSRTRTNVVFGEGNPNAPLVFVGEGPGENEDATGRPFVGRAGKLLDEVLRRNGMTRDHVYICNVVKCRAADMVSGRYQNRPPTPDEISSCQPWLEEQMRTIKPLVVVCVGGPAANTIIHKGFRITSERGKWFDNSGYAPWAMAVFHPAYILRLDGPSYGAALETLVEDIGKARQKVIEVKRQLKEAAIAAPPSRSLFD